MTQLPFKLSICIPTFNRAKFIVETLESITSQATHECEIVVSDNASTDETEQVVSDYARRFDNLRYVRQSANLGFDRNCDGAVVFARGEYCWLFSDDDLMKPGAIATVLGSLRKGHSLVLVNGEHRDVTMRDVRIPSFFGLNSDRLYTTDEFDRLFMDVGTCVMCVCCVVIKRSLWIARERQRYYGSWFVHTAVVFQQPIPGSTLVIAKPLICLRLGNEQTAQAAHFHVWGICWPELLWSFPLQEATKKVFCNPDPWWNFTYLLALRAIGQYSHADYNRWLRPRMSKFRQMLIPTLVALLSRKAAANLYRIRTSLVGGPSSPYDALFAMFPKSLHVLRPDATSAAK